MALFGYISTERSLHNKMTGIITRAMSLHLEEESNNHIVLILHILEIDYILGCLVTSTLSIFHWL